nr:hypothetical protein [Ningiella sp. W23]
MPAVWAVENNSKNDTLQVVYPKTMRSGENEILYPLVLLRAALQSSGQSFTLNASSISMAQSRSLKQIIHNDEVNVAWTMTSKQREQELLPVRVPIFKGLYGWRLLVTTQNKLNNFTSINSLSDFKQIHFIQGHDWPDTQILLDSGLTVATSIEYSSLFKMLIKGRGDVFPRSLLEVEMELNTFKDDTGGKLAVVPHLMLQYPTAIYFFLVKTTQKLRKLLKKGLQLCVITVSSTVYLMPIISVH